MEDLRRRLIGSTVEEFLARKDVEFIDIIEEGYLPAEFDEDEDAYEEDEDYDDDEYDDEREEDGGVGAGDPAYQHPRLEEAEVISATDGPVVDRSAEPGPHRPGAEPQAGPAGPAGSATELTEADREGEEGHRAFVDMTLNLIAAVDAWCFNEGLVPSRQLAKAAAFMLASK